MDEWLSAARDRLAAAADDDPAAYELTPSQVGQLLELARVAAHDSGARTNAPLVCYLAGLAHARGGGDLAHIVEAVVGAR